MQQRYSVKPNDIYLPNVKQLADGSTLMYCNTKDITIYVIDKDSLHRKTRKLKQMGFKQDLNTFEWYRDTIKLQEQEHYLVATHDTGNQLNALNEIKDMLNHDVFDIRCWNANE